MSSKSFALPLLALFLAACGGDDATGVDGSVRLDGGAPDAPPGMDAPATDAPATDAPAADGGTPADAACSTCFAAAYDYGFTGGRNPIQNRSHIEACRAFVYTSMNRSTGASMMCGNDAPCAAPALVDAEDINAALANADVVAALAAAPILYGIDTRPVDGSVFEIEDADGDIITIGSPCSTTSGVCVPVPPGVAALQDLLLQLEMERLLEPDCSTVFPEP